MINFFTWLYPNTTSKKNAFLERLRYYSLIRFTLRHTLNKLLPLYFKISQYFPNNYKLEKNENSNLIVSFTSFPDRINKVWYVVETILRQTVKPDKLILWLSKEQFGKLNDLPSNLLKLRERGLEIVLCEGDLRSHKKYYYTVKKYPHSTFVVIDDDVLYPSTLLENLLKLHKNYPETVCFNSGYNIPIHENQVGPYVTWSKLNKQTGPRKDILPIGAGAVLYPPNVLSKEVLNMDAFMKHCRLADDLWLYSMVLLNNKELIKSDNNQRFIPILYKKNITLTSINVGEGKNDEQFKSIQKYLSTEFDFDILKVILNEKNKYDIY